MEPQITISKTEKPNSFEFGPAGARMKIYFDDPAELVVKISSMKRCGLIDVSLFPQID
jgi:hypothetical protein